jgi:hypothetical protein
MSLFNTGSAYGGLSLVVNKLFSDIWIFVALILGIILAFWIISLLIDMLKLRSEMKKGIGLFGQKTGTGWAGETTNEQYELKEWLYKNKDR